MNGTLPYSIGVKAQDKECCSNLLLKGAILPAYIRKNYTATSNPLVLELCKNDCDAPEAELSACTPLANVSFDLPENVNENVEIIYTAGLNGLLIVTCKCDGKIVEKEIDL